MSERLTAVAQDVIAAAAAVARENRHREISTGHILLAIATAERNLGAESLAALGVTGENIRRRLAARKTSESLAAIASAPYTEAASIALEAAGREARSAGAGEIAPEHILLALMSAQTNTAVLIVHDLGTSGAHVRATTLERMKTVTLSSHDRNVFVVHGRDDQARRAMFDFLHALDLMPLDWENIVHVSGSSAPFIGEALIQVFDHVQATIIVFTPDDFGQLHPDFHELRESTAETTLTGQARANVLYEAGMAMMKMPDRTTFVEIGEVRPFTDIAGRSIVKLSQDPVEAMTKLKKIVGRLAAAGCRVNDSGTDWMRVDRFTSLSAHKRSALS